MNFLPPAVQSRYWHCNWNLITSNPWVLNAIQGYQLELESNPVQMGALPQLQYKQQEMSLILEEVGRLIQKGAIAPVNPSPKQFFSQIFVVPKNKKDRTDRFKSKCSKQICKMSGFQDGRATADQGSFAKEDWMVTVDLKMHIYVYLSQQLNGIY